MDYLIKIENIKEGTVSKFEITGHHDHINIFLILDEDKPENDDNLIHYELEINEVNDFIKALKRAKKDQQKIINRMKKIEKDDNKS